MIALYILCSFDLQYKLVKSIASFPAWWKETTNNSFLVPYMLNNYFQDSVPSIFHAVLHFKLFSFYFNFFFINVFPDLRMVKKIASICVLAAVQINFMQTIIR